jgi:hypothetical protein
MQDLPNVKNLREQARCVQEEYPELYDYLVHRDKATGELVREVMRAIPHPDELPVIIFPFLEAVIEIMSPKENCPVCKNEEMLWLLSRAKRAILCQVCKHGIFLKGTGIGSLAG